MTATAIEPENLERLERLTLTRTYEAELEVGDGRTIDAKVVPYGVPALVVDPGEPPYKEMFVRGAFERQVTAPNRVWLNFEHEQGLRGIVGHGVELAERDDGLYGSFRVHDNADGDKALHLVNERLLPGLSIEFVALRSRLVTGIVQRLRVHMDKVSLCRSPAYEAAQVLAVREEPQEPEFVLAIPPEVVIPARPDEVAGRLEALGVTPLLRIATTSKGWDGSPARFTDEEYSRSALFCRPGDDPPKQRCSLPVLEPDGTLNVNALGAAAGALAGARGGVSNASPAMKAAAARKLIRYYNQANMEPPASLRAVAGSA